MPINKADYNKRVATTIKSLRILKKLKQSNIANVLCIDQSVYCRMENGEVDITTGELRIISDVLNSSIFQIISITEYGFNEEVSHQNSISLAGLIVNYMLSELNHKPIDEYSESDYKKVLNIIQKQLEKMHKP